MFRGVCVTGVCSWFPWRSDMREGGGYGDSLLSLELISKPSALPKPSKMP